MGQKKELTITELSHLFNFKKDKKKFVIVEIRELRV
jgi:hypothetical protein